MTSTSQVTGIRKIFKVTQISHKLGPKQRSRVGSHPQARRQTSYPGLPTSLQILQQVFSRKESPLEACYVLWT